MPKISEQRKAEVRNQLVDAAIDVLLDEGPGATSRRILERAGLSAGALYHYFSSLDELHVAVAERFTELDAPLFEADVDAGDDPAAALASIHRQVLADLFAPGHHTIFGQLRVAAKNNDGIRVAMSRYDELAIERAGALNRASQDVGLFRSDVDADALVEVVSTFFEGFATKDAVTGFVTSRQRVLGLFLELVSDRTIDPEHPLAEALRRQLHTISE